MNEDADEIFLRARELADPAERDAWVREACGDDAALRERLERMLADETAADAFFERPAASGMTPTLLEPVWQGGEPGEIISRYKLLQQIGEGGFGAVWMAEQVEPLTRRVALKIIKPGMDTREVIARFEAERQALAMMDHPNIARVLDAGATDAGRPFFVMELVKGIPITRFCDERRFGTRQRLELFADVCSAVNHAHQKGIIHRDIKPTNVMVTLHGDKAVVKVIDFGIAKATQGKLTEKTLFTRFEQFIGTPVYMSPEQAALSGLDIDTRSDIYSLGVLLYELLTGKPPFDAKTLASAGYEEMRRIIREVEPPKPSSRLGTVSGEERTTLARAHNTEPEKLHRLVQPDLDWIAMKAIEKDRARRYETANSLALDIQRFLADEPVSAGPPDMAYRIRKFARRHRGPVIAAGLVLAALVLGIIGTTFGLLRAEHLRQLAQQNEQTAQTQKQQAIEFRDMALDALRETTGVDVQKLLGQRRDIGPNERAYLEAIIQRWKKFESVGGDDEQGRAMRAEAHYRMAELLQRLGRHDEALEAFEIALPVQEPLVRDFPNATRHRKDLAASLMNAAAALNDLARHAEAEAKLQKAFDIQGSLVAGFPENAEYRQGLAACHNSLGMACLGRGNRQAAEDQFSAALEIREKLAADFPDKPEYRRDLAPAYMNLGLTLSYQALYPQAAEKFRQALAALKSLESESQNDAEYRHEVATIHMNLGNALAKQGERRQAIEAYREGMNLHEKLAEEFPNVPDYRAGLAACGAGLGNELIYYGEVEEGQQRYREAITLYKKLAAEFPSTPRYRYELATTCNYLGIIQENLLKLDDAREQYHEALAAFDDLTARFPDVPGYRSQQSGCHNGLGNLYVKKRAWKDAEQHYRQSIAIAEKLTAGFPDKPDYRRELAIGHLNLSAMFFNRGEPLQAEETCRHALDILERLHADNPHVPGYRGDLAGAHNSLGTLLAEAHKPREAEESLRKAQTAFESLLAGAPDRIDYQIGLGGACATLGRVLGNGDNPADSLEWFARALEVLTPLHEKNPDHGKAHLFLWVSYANRARALHRLGHYENSLQDWDQALTFSPRHETGRVRAQRALSLVRADRAAEAVDEVERLERSQNWHADQWFGFACVYAAASARLAEHRKEYAGKAVEHLRQAISAGFGDAAKLAAHSDLASLREREDFRNLLAELEDGGPPSQ